VFHKTTSLLQDQDQDRSVQNQDQDQDRFFWSQTDLVLRPTASDHIIGCSDLQISSVFLLVSVLPLCSLIGLLQLISTFTTLYVAFHHFFYRRNLLLSVDFADWLKTLSMGGQR